MRYTYRVSMHEPVNLLELSGKDEGADPCDSLDHVSCQEADRHFLQERGNPRVTQFRAYGSVVNVHLETGRVTFDSPSTHEIHITFDRVNHNRRG